MGLIRRRFNRWQINYPAKLQLEGKEYIHCQVMDMSLKGAKIILPLKLPEDSFINFTLAFSGEFLFTIEAWIAWQRHLELQYIYGLYFTKISDKDKEGIFQFMRRNFAAQMNRAWFKEEPGQEKGGEEMEDRRIFERFKAIFPTKFLDLNRNREGIAQTDNVSAKGLSMIADKELPPQTPVEMWLEIPDKGDPLYARGEVVWSKKVEPEKFKVGVNLEKADLMGLSRVLRAI
jgi:hypothetical protein